ncbi:unnamed protein product [Orchesella dallaii]|uniref:Uncharacterized protein n=1 Tax=Orchesella dallaii TaxID=48710 RepID=A0ABP1QGB5_9HEXA
MEQATTGKAPPSIAINSGGGIQLINMNAVQRGAVGATVVPSPGSAQKGTVVGSPGPPGNAVGVGPRMISITPQMLASRPGQPVDEQSDSGSVNPSDELNTSSGQSCSPASITGVSCDLIAVNYDECEKGKIKDDDNGSENGFVKASDIHVEGNNRSNESQHGDENDLSLSTTPDGNSIAVSWPPKVVTERSVDSRCLNKSHPNSPSFHPEQSKTDCDENENNDCKLGSLGSNVQDNSKPSSSMPDEIGSSPIKDTSKLEQVDVIDVRERLSVIQGAQELVRVRVGSGKNGSSHKEESDLCVNESEVPIPINASNESEKVDSCQSEKSSNSKFFSIDSKDQQSQNCVQIEKMNLDVKLPLSCDNSEKSVLTVTSVKDQVAEAASVLNQESEPPPLVHDDKDSSAGNNNALTRGDSSSSVDPVESVDDVNLDMFADPLDAPVSEKSDDSKSKDANSTEENEESRPKLMDMNLADYMYMDFEDDDGGNNSWNQTRPSTVQHYSSSQQPLSQPKVSTSAAPSSSVASVSTEVPVTSSSNSGSSTWAVPRTAPQALEAPPSCAFQLYTVGQGQQGIRMQTANQAQIAARIPMGNEAFQQHIQSDPSKYPRPTYSAPTTVSASHSSRANITNPNTSFEYKANDSQSYFTTDPQLHSQFLQYTKNYPLPGVNKPEAVQHLSPGAMPVSHHVPSQQDLHAKQFPSARPLMVPQHHPSTQISSRNPLVQPQQRQVYPNQQYHHAVHQQSLQSQSHPTNPSYRANMNGCDVSKQAYNMAHVRPAFQSRSASGGQGQPPNLNIRPAPMTGVYPSVNVPSSNLHHVSHIQPQRHQLPKDMSSCTYATSGVMQQPSLPYTFTGTASSVSHPTNSVASTYPLVTGNYGQPALTGRHQASLVNHTTRASTLPAYQPSTTSSVQSRGNQYSPGATPPGWSVPIVVSNNNNPLTSYSTNPNIRVSSQPASYQYSTQNLGARETTAFKPEVQTANRMPYTNTSSTMGAQQYRYPQSNYSSVNRPQVPQGPRMPSVITRYPSTGTQSACAKPDGGNAWNEINHYNSQQKQMMSSSMPSPQMLRNPHYIAQFRNPSSGIQQQDSSSVACQQSVIRPVSLNTSNLMSRSGTGANTQAMVGAQSGNISGNSQFYGNQQYQQMSSSASSSQQQPYYSNQASVIRAPQSSNSISSNSQVGSCSLAVKGVNHSGYHASSSGYSGDLTLQSFLSNPSAPFISPPSSSERSPSGYGNENMGWGGERPCRDGGVSTEDYPLSSCQYSDAMRRYNAVRNCLFFKD